MRNWKLIGLISLCFTSFGLLAQDNLNALTIPEELTKGADAVVRFNNTIFEITSKNEVTTTYASAVTIFNDRGKESHGTFVAYTSELQDVKDIQVKVIDAMGNTIKTLKRRDFSEVNPSGNSYSISDDRMIVASFEDVNYPYPYTLVYSYEEVSKLTMFYPSWHPVCDENTAIQYASLTVKNPLGIAYRYKEMNYADANKTYIEKLSSEKKWELKNKPAIKYETYSLNNHLPEVQLAPVEVMVQNISLNSETWSGIGKYYYDLNKDRQALPAETIAEVKALIQPSDDTFTKASKVYKYMQSKTRYINVSLGIGGWQARTAMEVATKGYGDCKGLTNFTVALLQAVGVEAYSALVFAGQNKVGKTYDFPMSKFNHVIACVPSGADTLWLECTSQTDPAGYQGSFTGNRKALLLKPTGGVLINTLAYTASDNSQNRTVQAKLQEDGSAKISTLVHTSGIQQDMKSQYYQHYNSEQQRNYVLKQISIPNFDLIHFTHDLQNKHIPVLKEEWEIDSRSIGQKSGKRLFIKPYIFESFFDIPAPATDRKTPLFLNPNIYTFLDTDSVTFDLPKGSSIEHMPESISEESVFGTYKADIKRNGDQLIYTRRVEMKGGEYPADSYQAFYDFIKTVKKADKARVVILLEET